MGEEYHHQKRELELEKELFEKGSMQYEEYKEETLLVNPEQN